MNDLFDLTTIFTNDCYRGLYVDHKLLLWSKQNGRYRRLANQWSLPDNNYPYSIFEMRSKISESPIFAEFLKKVKSTLDEYQENKESLKGKYVIAMIDDNGTLVFSKRPQISNTREEAELKLMRFSQLNTKARFCLFECKGVLKSAEIVLE